MPKGWDESRVKRVAEHYEAQTDEEGTEEDESAYTITHTSLIVPVDLVGRFARSSRSVRRAKTRGDA